MTFSICCLISSPSSRLILLKFSPALGVISSRIISRASIVFSETGFLEEELLLIVVQSKS